MHLHGVTVPRITAVGDDEESIFNAVESAMSRADIVITTGGLGSTHDDITKEVLARMFNSKIVVDQKAVAMLEKIETEFFYDILADDAIFALAEIYQKKLKDTEKAKSLYEKILLEFKGSIYSSEARKRFRQLRGDNLEENQPL